MLKALLHKQLLEIFSSWFVSRKTGKQRSEAGVIGMIAVFVMLFLFLGGAFFAMCEGLSLILKTDNEWLYFAITGMIAMFLGVFGSVFNTYAALYRAKDNEQLLAMPIPPAKILLSRLLGVAITGLLYEAIVIIPAIIVRFIEAPVTVTGVLFSLLMILLLAVLITVLTCLLGWVVALVSSRLKNNSIVTVIISAVCLFAYYMLCARLSDVMESIITHFDLVGAIFRKWLPPFYALGRAAEGDILMMLLFTLGVAALFVITWIAMSRTFLGVVTRSESGSRTVYREKAARVRSLRSALFSREMKHFLSNATYMLNTGMGSLFMIGLGVFVLIKQDAVNAALPSLLMMVPFIGQLLPLIVLVITCVIASMNIITSPSVSLEGHSLWIIQSLPVPAWKVLLAKLDLHLVITLPPALFMAGCFLFIIRASLLSALLVLAAVCCYVVLHACFGLFANLKAPNFTWTNEAMPIKQSLSVFISMIGGFVLTFAIGILGYFTHSLMSATAFLACLLAVLVLADLLLLHYLKTHGARIFADF